MSGENMEIIERAVAALNARDIDGYLACCTDDVQLETPLTPIEGVYEGEGGIRRFFSDVVDAGPDFRVTVERLQPVGSDRVIGFMRVSVSGRESGVQLPDDIPTTNVYELADGRIRRTRIFRDRQKAL